MKILFFIIDLNSGGAEWQLARLAAFLHKQGIAVKVVCMNSPNDVYDFLKHHGIDTECLGYESPWQLLRLLRLIRIIRRFQTGYSAYLDVSCESRRKNYR